MSSYRPGRDLADDYHGNRRGHDARNEDYRDRDQGFRDSYDQRDFHAHNSRGGRGGRGGHARRDYDQRHYRSRSRSPMGDPRDHYRDRDGSQHRDGLRYSDDDPQEIEKYDGAKDVDTECHTHGLVLIRNIKPSVSKDVLAKGLERVCQNEESPSGADPAKLYRILMIHSRDTDRSMGFAFVQFHSRSDAMAAVQKSKELGDKCTVSSQKMILDYARNAFLPTVFATNKRMPEKYLIPWYSGESFFYYREDMYPTELVINASPPANTEEDASSPPDSSNQDGTTTGTAKKTKKGGAAVNEQISVWNNARAELRSAAMDNAAKTKKTAIPFPKVEHEQTFTIDHPKARCCLLCWREFDHSKTLPKHVKYSDIHAEMLADPAAVEKAWERMEEYRIDPEKTIKCGKPLRGATVESKVDEAAKSEPMPAVSFSLKNAAAPKKV